VLSFTFFGQVLFRSACGCRGGRRSFVLFAVSSSDPTTLASVALLVTAAAAAASYLPARRATRIDPVVALRQA
jgi:ABC-type antimicrobial peptide transport system permease subunit